MKIVRLLFLLVVVAFMVSCSSSKKPGSIALQQDAPLQGDTTKVKDDKKVADFQSATVFDATTVDVVLNPDSACRVEVDGEKVYTDAQQAEVDGGELTLKFADYDSGHRQTRVKISAPSLTGLKVVGCGKLQVSGANPKCSNFNLHLERVSVAMIDPLLSAQQVVANVSNVMFARFRVDCDDLQLTSRSIDHIKVFGHAKHRSIDADNIHQIDQKGLK